MATPSRRTLLATPLLAGLLPRAAAAQAGDWPSRPIRLIVPYAPGGGNDLIARWVSEKLRPILPQPIIVENRSGAQGMLGIQALLGAPADGHAAVQVNSSITLINPVVHANPGYDTFRDFAPVLQYGSSALVLTIRPDRGIRTMAELLAEARRRPGELTYASFGIGSASHIYGAALEKVGGVQMTHVPYRSTNQAVQDVLSGSAFMSINDEGVSIPHVQAGTLLALAVTGKSRVDTLPDVPTFHELGLNGGLELVGFNALMMRAGTPPAIVQRFADAILSVLRTAEGRERLRQIGTVMTAMGPAEFGAQLRHDAPIWAAAARESGARVE